MGKCRETEVVKPRSATLRSGPVLRDRLKYSALSVLSLDVAMKRFLRHVGIVGSLHCVSSIFDKKYEASSMPIDPSVFVGSSASNARRTSGVSMYPKRAVTWMIPS